MFHKALEADLKTIFKVKNVRFEPLAGCLEQAALCVDITSTCQVFRPGQAFMRISGTVGLKGTLNENLAGFLSRRVEEAQADTLSCFWFSAAERPAQLPFGWELKGFEKDFVYFYQTEYAPASGLISYAKLFWRLLTGANK